MRELRNTIDPIINLFGRHIIASYGIIFGVFSSVIYKYGIVLFPLWIAFVLLFGLLFGIVINKAANRLNKKSKLNIPFIIISEVLYLMFVLLYVSKRYDFLLDFRRVSFGGIYGMLQILSFCYFFQRKPSLSLILATIVIGTFCTLPFYFNLNFWLAAFLWITSMSFILNQLYQIKLSKPDS